jgi:UPF0176 protein
MEVNRLPQDVQKELRKGLDKSNLIFKKGRSEKLLFKPNRDK